MQPKRPRRTRERILRTALVMFNKFGEHSVATTAIAFEMGISPGNLYYHFRSKDEIVHDLFDEFRREIEATLAAPDERLPNAEDVWLFLHLVFEAIAKYRFVYRDLNDLISRYRFIEVQFRRILAHKQRVAEKILSGLVANGQMLASPREVSTLALNVTMMATYWLSFEYARDPRADEDGHALGRGVFHVMSLSAPYLEPRVRAQFDQLAERYIS
ncbi:MAG: TetR/AcrR family transcriptional regulator [Roseiarcus sp.]